MYLILFKMYSSQTIVLIKNFKQSNNQLFTFLLLQFIKKIKYN